MYICEKCHFAKDIKQLPQHTKRTNVITLIGMKKKYSKKKIIEKNSIRENHSLFRAKTKREIRYIYDEPNKR